MRFRLQSRLAEERWYWSKARERAGEERHGVSRVDTYAAAREQSLERHRCDSSGDDGYGDHSDGDDGGGGGGVFVFSVLSFCLTSFVSNLVFDLFRRRPPMQ